MTIDPYGQWMGVPMDSREIEAMLDTTGYGILSLAKDDEPYSIPVSFGYDGENVYFAFIKDSPENEKFQFIDDGAVARLLVTDIRARFDWQSIAITGPVEPINLDDDWDTVVDSLEDNAWFSTDFERSEDVEGVQGWRLAPENVKGLEVTPDNR